MVDASKVTSTTMRSLLKHVTNLILMRYWASATASGFPVMVIVRSVLPLSRSSQFEIRIIAPEICRISAILVPPLPMMQPISSFGTVISCVCWFEFCWLRELLVRNCEPAKAARAERNCNRSRQYISRHRQALYNTTTVLVYRISTKPRTICA